MASKPTAYAAASVLADAHYTGVFLSSQKKKEGLNSTYTYICSVNPRKLPILNRNLKLNLLPLVRGRRAGRVTPTKWVDTSFFYVTLGIPPNEFTSEGGIIFNT